MKGENSARGDKSKMKYIILLRLKKQGETLKDTEDEMRYTQWKIAQEVQGPTIITAYLIT